MHRNWPLSMPYWGETKHSSWPSFPAFAWGICLKVSFIPHWPIWSSSWSPASVMEGVLLSSLGRGNCQRTTHPQIELSELDSRTHFLQANSIEMSNARGYTTGAHDYISFCVNHSLPLDPTLQTLSWYIAYTSRFIGSGPKYLSGACHFLSDLYPSFNTNHSHPLVQATISGSKKIWADPVKQKLPLRTSHLQTFLEVSNSSNDYDDCLFVTIISCCFYGCHWIGELISNNDTCLRDWWKIIKRASLHFSSSRAGYHLPYHKSDRFYQGTEITFHLSQNHRSCITPMTLH